jgi:hypothetical protein
MMTVPPPDPFWGTCTLVICKPKIRSKARVGDWIVGLGAAKTSLHSDYRGKIVYAMKVTSRLTMKDYDTYVKERLPRKEPQINSDDWRMRLGDSLYDFSAKGIPQRPGVHRRSNRKTDIGGKNALLSSEFVYYGRNAIPLPGQLKGILHAGQGHRSNKNDDYIPTFERWWEAVRPKNGESPIKGDPQLELDPLKQKLCAIRRQKESEDDLAS